MYVLVDKKIRPEEKEKLKKKGFCVLETAPLRTMDNRLSTHPDIQIHFLEKTLAVCEPTLFSYYQKILPPHIRLIPGKSVCTSTYPKDSAYNVTRIGKHIFANTRYTEPIILDFYHSKNYPVHHVRQGYTKCNSCILDDENVITEDKGLHNVFMENNIHALCIQPGGIELEGYPYGFIGGTCGSYKNCIYFYGTLSKHPQGKTMEEWIKKCEKNICMLSDNKLQDNGSIFFFD